MDIAAINAQFPPIRVPTKHEQGIERFIFKYFPRWLREKGTGKEIPPARFHRELYYIVSHPRNYPRAIIVAPRGFAKSIITMFFSPLYDAIVGGKDLFEEILLIGASQELTDGWLSKIKQEITNNEELREDFGELSTDGMRDGKWTENHIKLTNGVSIMTRGRGGAMRGLHPQKIAIDDIEGDEGALSPTECEKIEQWMKAAVIPMQLDSGSVLHWDGTFLAPDSVLHKAYHRKGWEGAWFRYKKSAIEDGQSVWPERFPMTKLKELQILLGTRIFNAEYMNEPIASVNPIVRREWIQYYTEEERPEFMYKVMAVDPAISTRRLADKTAIGVVGADNDPDNPRNRCYVLDVDQGHWDLGSTVRRIFDMYRAWHPDLVIIETTAYQQALAETIRRESRDMGLYLPIKEVKPSKDKVTRLMAVAPMIEAGDVYFRKTQTELVDQLLLFPASGNDDLVDVMSYTLGELKTYWQYVVEHTERYVEDSEPAIPVLGW